MRTHRQSNVEMLPIWARVKQGFTGRRYLGRDDVEVERVGAGRGERSRINLDELLLDGKEGRGMT